MNKFVRVIDCVSFVSGLVRMACRMCEEINTHNNNIADLHAF